MKWPCLICGAIQQALAADGAIACFSSNFFLRGLNADRAPQLKRSVGLLSCTKDNDLEGSPVHVLENILKRLDHCAQRLLHFEHYHLVTSSDARLEKRWLACTS